VFDIKTKGRKRTVEPKIATLHRSNPIAAFLAALILAACLISLPAAAEDCVVKIGTAGPMTGGGASWGLAEKAGVDFEALWVNEHGGLQVGNQKCKVVVVPVDALSTVAGGAAASNYLASQGVHALNGPIVGPENSGFKPVAKRNCQVTFCATFAADAIGPDFPLAFHQLQSPPVWGALVVKAVKDFYNLSSAVLIGPNDQGGVDTSEALQKLYNAAGVTTKLEYYQRGTTNFAPIVARIMGMDVSVVDLTSMPPGEAGILAKQLNEAGYSGVLGRLGAGGAVIIGLAGGVSAQKAFYWFDHIPSEDPGPRQFRADFERMMKTTLPDNALVYNAQIVAENLLRAISIAGTDADGERIAAALRSTTPESRYLGKAGWRGKSQYGINQEFSFPVGVHMIKDGKIVKELRIDISSE
jgi:branched-chain amino acid transport system substrate-binding protein